jgi:hypothetical protein
MNLRGGRLEPRTHLQMPLGNFGEGVAGLGPLLGHLVEVGRPPVHLQRLVLIALAAKQASCTGDQRDQSKGVGPSTTLAWPGWKQPDIPVEVDTARLETSSTDTVKGLPGYPVQNCPSGSFLF